MSAGPSAKDGRSNLLLFGIDFGTTYTGVAWAWSRKPQDIYTITKWESELYQNSDREKAPTTIHYGNNASEISWGYGVPLSQEPLQWFKLLLLNDADVPEHLRHSGHLKRAKDMLREQNKTAVDVIGDYLGLLWKHVLNNVMKTLGKTAVNRTPFHVVITVPAIWKGYACAKMREAAIKGGILSERSCGPTTLGFISEPESAARSTLADMGGGPDLLAGDAITVVDCGGGTVVRAGLP
jgi:molecular chaperone DnaK (HSP70)